MKIAFFDDRFDQVYGAQENVLLLAELSAEASRDVVIVTTEEGSLAAEARRRGLTVEVVPAPPTLRRFEGTTFDGGLIALAQSASDLVRYNLALGAALRRQDVDVILSAAVRPSMLLLGARLLTRRPIILYAQNSIPRGGLAVLAGLASRRICLISDGARSTFPLWFLRRFASRFTDLPSGRDLDRYRVAREVAVGASQRPLELITVSSLTKRKGLHVLIEAAAEVVRRGCPVRLTVVGGTTGAISEAYVARLREQADDARLDLEIVGWQANVVPFLAGADVFALASENEGLPGVLIEAMAAGLPCVSTRAGGAGDLVEAASAGAAVEIGDVDGLADALFDLCRDAERRQAAGQRALAHVRARYDLDSFQQRFETVLATVVPAEVVDAG